MFWGKPRSERGTLMRFMVITLIALSAPTLLGLGAVQADNPYGFEAIQENTTINGQDNWVDQPGQGQAIVMLDSSPVNGTKVVRHLPTVGFHESAFITRVNDANFGFAAYAGTETDAVMQFDLTGDHVALFALGHDINGDGMCKVTDGEVGPAFGTHDQNFRIQQANAGPVIDIPLGPGNARYEWYQLQFHLDFTANEGDGSGSLYFRNLSDGDPTYQPVAGLQDVPLGMSAMHPAAAPASWNAMWMHLLTGGGNTPSADNLVPVVSQPAAVASGQESHLAPTLNGSSLNISQRPAEIRFDLPSPTPVWLAVIDPSGRRIRRLISGVQHAAGPHRIDWDIRDDSGRSLVPGVYFYRLETGQTVRALKILVTQ